VVLAADALSGTSPAWGLFVDETLLPELIDSSEPISDPLE
jgi:hypothetical protein